MKKRNVKHPNFSITGHKGVQITFANRVCISIQWGPGNYCGDYPAFGDFDAPRKADYWNSQDAEIAIFPAESGDWLTKQAHKDITGEELGDDVIGHLSPDEVFKYIAWAQAYVPAKVTP